LHNINTVIMDVLIIEDEILAAERMQLLIKNYDPSINIVGLLESVEEAVEWLNTKTHPDFIVGRYTAC
jgi:DNA-binding NarL/FixJ family response regulator